MRPPGSRPAPPGVPQVRPPIPLPDLPRWVPLPCCPCSGSHQRPNPHPDRNCPALRQRSALHPQTFPGRSAPALRRRTRSDQCLYHILRLPGKTWDRSHILLQSRNRYRNRSYPFVHPYLYGIVNDILPLHFEKSKNIWCKCEKNPKPARCSLLRNSKKHRLFHENALPGNFSGGH